MVEIRKTYPAVPPSALATFNFSEVISGTGFQTFYGFNSELTGGLDYHLGESIGFSEATGRSAQAVAGGPTTATIDLDFDTSTFNSPRILEGVGIVSLGWGLISNSSGGGNANVVVTIKKNDSTIVSATSATVSFSGGNTKTQIEVMPLTVPLTRFEIGDTLRLTVLVTLNITGGSGTVDLMFGHDPKDRDFAVLTPSSNANETTQIIFKAPFKITDI